VACSRERILTATVRARAESWARNTRPIPPPPTYSSNSNCPKRMPGPTRSDSTGKGTDTTAAISMGARPEMTVGSLSPEAGPLGVATLPVDPGAGSDLGADWVE